MANVLGYTRSETFRVRDEKAFRDWAKDWGIYVDDHEPGIFQIFSSDDHGNGCYTWPESHDCDENCDETCMPTDASCGVSRDFLVGLAKHLEDDRMVLLFQAYTEKAILHGAEAIALHSDGRRVKVTLNDAILKRAAMAFFGSEPTLYEELQKTESVFTMQDQFNEFAMQGTLDLHNYEASINRSLDALNEHIRAVRDRIETLRQHQVAGCLKH